MARSPHRALAIFPLDREGGEIDVTPQATAQLEGKLRADGLTVTGRAKTQTLYSSSTLRGRAFLAADEAADYGRLLKVQAVLVGRVRGAYDAAERLLMETRFEPVPAPACCQDRQNPCISFTTFDPMLKTYVPSCSGSHKEIKVRSPHTERYSGMTVDLRLVDAASGQTLWQTSYEVPRENGPLAALCDRVTDVLADQLSQAYLSQHL